MTPVRRRRLFFVLAAVTGMALAVGLTLYALQQNINLFFSPSQIAQGEAPIARQIRVGGLVVPGSVERDAASLQVSFRLTDEAHEIGVRFDGILPDLFREGQGIVAIGQLGDDGVVLANEVLAKHDENYMPPEVAEALKASGQWQHSGGQGGS